MPPLKKKRKYTDAAAGKRARKKKALGSQNWLPPDKRNHDILLFTARKVGTSVYIEVSSYSLHYSYKLVQLKYHD